MIGVAGSWVLVCQASGASQKDKTKNLLKNAKTFIKFFKTTKWNQPKFYCGGIFYLKLKTIIKFLVHLAIYVKTLVLFFLFYKKNNTSVFTIYIYILL